MSVVWSAYMDLCGFVGVCVNMNMNMNYAALYKWCKTALPYKFYRNLTEL